MPDRRVVRVGNAFFDQLDDQLGSERGPSGEPSATDFLVLDLPSVVERFATGFDDLPEAIEGVPETRMLIATGRLVAVFAVFGVLVDDGAIELVAVSIEA